MMAFRPQYACSIAPEELRSRARVLTILHKHSEIVLGHVQGWP